MDYVLIDRENMRFLNKGPYEYLMHRGSLEYISTLATCLYPISPAAFMSLTFLELQLLYKNTTGEKCPGFSYSHAISACLGCAASILQDDKYRLSEVIAQHLWVETNDPDRKKQYRYQFGAVVPQPLIQWTGETKICQPAPPDMPVLGQFAHAPQRPGVIESWRAATTDICEPAAPRVATPRAPREPGAVPTGPRGSVSQTIWEVADRLWEKEGKPTDKRIILNLRKQMMEILETEHSVKRNSASNELGQWQKARIIVDNRV